MRLGRSVPFTEACLWGLAIWAMFLSIETWIRTPGSPFGKPLPPRRLQLDGVTYEQVGKEKGKAVKELPSSAFLVRHWLVRYRRITAAGAAGASDSWPQQRSSVRQPAAALELADIEATGSGQANRLPIDKLQKWMNGKTGETNGCLVRKGNGAIWLITATAAGKTVTVPSGASKPGTIATWLSGLRPIEEVRCVWISSGNGMSREALRQIGSIVLR